MKLNTRGITLVELIIAVSLLTIVIFSAYFFLSFCTRSMEDTEAQFDAGQDARMALIDIEKDLRKAQDVIISGTRHKAVEVKDLGMTLNVYVNNDSTHEMVQYKLDGNKLKRGEASLGHSPTTWITIADNVNNASSVPGIPIFEIDGKKIIKINLLVLDEKDYLIDNPTSVNTSIAVRSKGAMD